MSALYDQLERQARLLSGEERAKLARVLIEDTSSENEVEALWIAEAQRRYKAFLEGDIG